MIRTYLSEEDVEKLIKAAPTLRDELIIRLLWRLGCRVSELTNLKVSDIDFKKNLVVIQHLKQRMQKICSGCGKKVAKSHSFCPSCGKKLGDPQMREEVRRRVIPVDKETLDQVKRYLKLRSDKSNRVIPLSRKWVYRIIREAAEAAGIGSILHPDTGREHYVSPHRLRDAFAVHAISVDPGPEGRVKLQKHLGHKEFDETAKYLKYLPDYSWYEKLWEESPSRSKGREAEGATR